MIKRMLIILLIGLVVLFAYGLALASKEQERKCEDKGGVYLSGTFHESCAFPPREEIK